MVSDGKNKQNCTYPGKRTWPTRWVRVVCRSDPEIFGICYGSTHSGVFWNTFEAIIMHKVKINSFIKIINELNVFNNKLRLWLDKITIAFVYKFQLKWKNEINWKLFYAGTRGAGISEVASRPVGLGSIPEDFKRTLILLLKKTQKIFF